MNVNLYTVSKYEMFNVNLLLRKQLIETETFLCKDGIVLHYVGKVSESSLISCTSKSIL